MNALTKLALELGLTKLPPHLPTFLGSFVFFNIVHLGIGPVLGRWLLGPAYGQMKSRAKNNVKIHVVSQVHALIVVPISFGNLYIDALTVDKAFGWDERAGLLSAIAAGYFLWDTLDCLIYFTDIGFVIHGAACLTLYLMTFKPFLAYYAPRFLLWEISTLFLNIVWFLDKMGRTGGKLQLTVAGCLLSSFFGARLVYGGMQSYQFALTLYNARHQLSAAYLGIFSVANAVLQALNWFWFGKMIRSVQKRFSSEQKVEGKKID